MEPSSATTFECFLSVAGHLMDFHEPILVHLESSRDFLDLVESYFPCCLRYFSSSALPHSLRRTPVVNSHTQSITATLRRPPVSINTTSHDSKHLTNMICSLIPSLSNMYVSLPYT
ncbi:hypothetical protein ACFE04_020246 [Oxalis oulophora]